MFAGVNEEVQKANKMEFSFAKITEAGCFLRMVRLSK